MIVAVLCCCEPGEAPREATEATVQATRSLVQAAPGLGQVYR